MCLPVSLVCLNQYAVGRWRFFAQVTLFGLLLIGSAAPGLAELNSPVGRFERLREQDLRVATVAYRLATANAGLCGQATVPQTGFVLHSIAEYGRADRADAARSFGLGDRVGVMAVVAGSPAAKAGLVAGDQLVAVNGRPFGPVGDDPVPTRASIDRASNLLAAVMASDAVTLRVSGPAGERDVRFAPEKGCFSAVEMVPGSPTNAWADGMRVMIGDGLLLRCASDDDLALVIGHEMAHNLLHHRQRLAAEGVSTNGLLPLTESGSAAMRETEEEADRFAVTLASGAGYDLSGAEAFMGGLLSRTIPGAPTHPAPARRLALLHAAIAAVQRGQAVRG